MRRIAFILDDFELRSPGQQLLDRFLIGSKASDYAVIAFVPNGASALIKQRVADFGLEVARSIEEAVSGANGIILAPGKVLTATHFFSSETYEQVLRPESVCCIDQLLLASVADVQRGEQLAVNRRVRLAVTTGLAFTPHLPVRPVYDHRGVDKVLVAGNGRFPMAEFEMLCALDGISLRERSSELMSCERFSGDKLWQLAYSSGWEPLLAGAISRSNNIKGDPEKDGRTQDIVGLHLVEKLAPDARGWLIRQKGGPELLLLLLDGALGDFNYAVSSRGRIYSALLYRPPAPRQDQYTGQAEWMNDFFRRPKAPTNIANAKFAAAVLERMRLSSGVGGA
jgi:hypothetical protein